MSQTVRAPFYHLYFEPEPWSAKDCRHIADRFPREDRPPPNEVETTSSSGEESASSSSDDEAPGADGAALTLPNAAKIVSALNWQLTYDGELSEDQIVCEIIKRGPKVVSSAFELLYAHAVDNYPALRAELADVVYQIAALGLHMVKIAGEDPAQLEFVKSTMQPINLYRAVRATM